MPFFTRNPKNNSPLNSADSLGLVFPYSFMPTVTVDRGDLFEALGRKYTEEELDELCFEYGIELDEWSEEGPRPEVKIEIPANRYDMLCFEGISRALRIYLGLEKSPVYTVTKPKLLVEIEPEVAAVRPFAAAAVLRGVKFTQRRYDSFIALQDKLHSNICRNRSLVAIGTHDLAKLQGPIRYRGLPATDFKFVPLNQTKEMTGAQVLEFYKQDRNLGKFVPLLDGPILPVFMDKNDQVLSLPPLINSDATKISLDTTDIFFDLTATDETKLEIVLNQMVTMFTEYAETPFEVEQVTIRYLDGSRPDRAVPDLSPRKMVAEVDYLNNVLGLDIPASEYASLVKKMALGASTCADGNIELSIPVTRADILHQCDIIEDAGIAYGFNNLKRTFPARAATLGKLLPLNHVADILRREAALATWVEVMPLTLCSAAENFDWLRRQDDNTAVRLGNPKTVEYEVVRQSLFPGLLKSIRENRKHTLPIRVFEAGDVVFKDLNVEQRARQDRHFAGVYAGKASGFEVTQGLVDRLLKMLSYQSTDRKADRAYWIEEKDQPTFFPGRAARIMVRHNASEEPSQVGVIGVFHPEVLANFEIPFVCSGFEMNVKEFL